MLLCTARRLFFSEEILLLNTVASVAKATDKPQPEPANAVKPEQHRTEASPGFVGRLVHARLLFAGLLVLVSVAGAGLFWLQRQTSSNTSPTLPTLLILAASALLSGSLLLGEMGARRQARALTRRVDDIAGLACGKPMNREGASARITGELGSLAAAVDRASEQVHNRTSLLEGLEAQYRLLLEHLPGASYVYSAAGDEAQVLYVSPQIERLLGFTPDEWANDPTLWAQLLHPEDRKRVLEQYAACCEGGEPFCCEYRIRNRAGDTVWLRDEAHITDETDDAACLHLMLGMLLDITPHRQALTSLQNTGERIADIVGEAGEAIVSLNSRGEIALFNKGAQNLFGYSDGEALGMPASALWPPAQAESYTRWLADFVGSPDRTKRLMQDGEIIIRHKGGHEFVAEGTVSRSVRGEGMLLTLVLRDITERKQAEGQLRALEAGFRAAFDSNPLPVWVYDLDTLRFLEVNAAAQAHYGYSRREFLSMAAHDLRAPEDMPRLVDLTASKAQDGLYSIQVRHRCKDGRIIDVQLMSQRLDFMGAHAALVVAEEITERKRAEQALRESEQRFRAMFEGSAIGTALVDLDGRYIKANPALQNMLGYSGDELGSLRFSQIAHQEDLQRSLYPFEELVAGHRDYYHQESRFVCKDGSVMWANLTMSLVRGNKRKPQFCILMAENITERKQSQEQIKRQLERLAALRNIDLTISSSLDLRVTLNVILDQVMSQLHVDATDVLLLNTHTQMLEYAAGRGFRQEAVARTRLRMGEGYAGRAALERRTLTVPDLSLATDLHADLLEGEDFASYYAVPLLVKGQVKGVLEIFHRSALNPQHEWLDFLEALTSQAAIAIDNATMFNDLQRSNTDLALAYDTTLEGWSHALDLRDEETEGHTQRVTEMTDRLARSMGVSESELVHVHRGALLHDIGKMGIPDAILLKPGPLSEEEWEIMRRHPGYAYQLLSPISFLRPSLDIPYCHHEKWDGTGYPRGLKGEQIPLSARIFAVVDVYDALRSDRPYRRAWSEAKVRDHISSLSGTHFDPKVVKAFLAMDMPASHPTVPLGGLWEYIERKLVEGEE